MGPETKLGTALCEFLREAHKTRARKLHGNIFQSGIPDVLISVPIVNSRPPRCTIALIETKILAPRRIEGQAISQRGWKIATILGALSPAQRGHIVRGGLLGDAIYVVVGSREAVSEDCVGVLPARDLVTDKLEDYVVATGLAEAAGELWQDVQNEYRTSQYAAGRTASAAAIREVLATKPVPRPPSKLRGDSPAQ
jgi:hypothetical protein